jgi:hypothetical protein
MERLMNQACPGGNQPEADDEQLAVPRHDGITHRNRVSQHREVRRNS